MQQPTASISPSTSTIPQFVVIHDQFQQSWKHPIVHYVFEGEDFPTKVPKSSCVVVNFAEDGENIKEAHSLSHTFQITNCKISSTPQIGAQAGKESGAVTASLMLTIEGVSAGKNEIDPSSNTFGLDQLLYDFKRRNELLRQTFGLSEEFHI